MVPRSRLPAVKVMAPKASRETTRPVSPSVVYCMVELLAGSAGRHRPRPGGKPGVARHARHQRPGTACRAARSVAMRVTLVHNPAAGDGNRPTDALLDLLRQAG